MNDTLMDDPLGGRQMTTSPPEHPSATTQAHAGGLRKPPWIRVQVVTGPMTRFGQVKDVLRDNHLSTVCEEASCPNIGECYAKGTATFMILGDVCTRRCPFCDVQHGRPKPVDAQEPDHLAVAVTRLGLDYAVVTSVNRDDLQDGGAGHFVACIQAIRRESPRTRVEVLVPDFRGRQDRALDLFREAPPDVMNHNLETVPRLYPSVRPGARYGSSLDWLQRFQDAFPNVPTKSGLMVGLGETDDEIVQSMRDMRGHGVSMLTIGQYLAPSSTHLKVQRYVHPDTFRQWEGMASAMGFAHAAVGPMVRSSYHAALQTHRAIGRRAASDSALLDAELRG